MYACIVREYEVMMAGAGLETQGELRKITTSSVGSSTAILSREEWECVVSELR